MFSFSTSYFSPERDPGVVNILSHILKNVFWQNLVKSVSSDKIQNHTRNTFSSGRVIADSKLSEKVVCISIFLKIWTLNLVFSYEKFSTFQWHVEFRRKLIIN